MRYLGAATTLGLVANLGYGTISAGTTEPSGGEAAFTLDEPLRFVGLWEIQGESSNANNALEDAAQIAIEEINAAGGVGGLPVEYVRVATNITDPTETIAAVRSALDENPSILIGPAGGAAGIAAAPIAHEAGIPMLALGQDTRLQLGNESGNEHTFLMSPAAADQQAVAAQIAIEELGATNIGILFVNVDFGTSALPTLREAIEAGGGQVTEERNYAFDATDLTAQVLAMEGSDAVINWGYPNPLGVQLNQFVENGIDIPTVAASSAAITVSAGLAEGEAIEQLYASTYCNPVDDDRDIAVSFVEKYRERAERDPDAVPTGAYDAVYVAVAAANAAQSSDPAAITEALSTVEVSGVCADPYKADDENVLSHQVTAVTFADGTPRTLRVYDTSE